MLFLNKWGRELNKLLPSWMHEYSLPLAASKRRYWAEVLKIGVGVMQQCHECGARFEGGNTCKDVFDEFLSLEFSNPDFGSVHFLTVACFMIQHDRYSDKGLSWIRSVLQDYLARRLTARQLREITASAKGTTGRDWAVMREPHTLPRRKVSWSITIADVAHQVGDPDDYR